MPSVAPTMPIGKIMTVINLRLLSVKKQKTARKWTSQFIQKKTLEIVPGTQVIHWKIQLHTNCREDFIQENM